MVANDSRIHLADLLLEITEWITDTAFTDGSNAELVIGIWDKDARHPTYYAVIKGINDGPYSFGADSIDEVLEEIANTLKARKRGR